MTLHYMGIGLFPQGLACSILRCSRKVKVRCNFWISGHVCGHPLAKRSNDSSYETLRRRLWIYLTFFCTKLTVEMCVVKVFFVFSIRKFHFIYSYVTRTFFYLSQITSIYKQYEKNTTAEHGTNVNITFKSKMSTFVSLGDLGIVPLLLSRPPNNKTHFKLIGTSWTIFRIITLSQNLYLGVMGNDYFCNITEITEDELINIKITIVYRQALYQHKVNSTLLQNLRTVIQNIIQRNAKVKNNVQPQQK
ncbi:hypothetical protein QTP88_009418 [Uroleucon formosanum]